MEIILVVYRLPQAGMLANNLPTQSFHSHGYYQVKRTPGLWRHVEDLFCSHWERKILVLVMLEKSMQTILLLY